MCLLTNERYKTYQTGFSFCHLGHASEVGLGGTVGVEWSKKNFPKFNQIWCVSYLHKRHMQRHNFLVPTPMGEAKRSNIINSQIQKSISKNFKLNFVCLLTNERYETYKTGFSFSPLGHACPRVWNLGKLGVKNLIF